MLQFVFVRKHNCTVGLLLIFLQFTQHTKDALHFRGVHTKILFVKVIVKIKEYE